MIRFATTTGVVIIFNAKEQAATGIKRLMPMQNTERVPQQNATDTGEIQVDCTLALDPSNYSVVLKGTPDELVAALRARGALPDACMYDLANDMAVKYDARMRALSQARVVSTEAGADPRMVGKLLGDGNV